MKITLTRQDIKQHAAALERIEELEEWLHGKWAAYRFAMLKQNNVQSDVRVNCGHIKGPHDLASVEEQIFRKHMDAAVEEAIVYWKQQAGLEENQ